MVQSPSWEANWFAVSQEIPPISRNPKVHYCTHKRPPPISILGQPNPVHIPTSHLLEIHPNIIHPSTPRSPHWSLSLRFPQQDPIHPPLSSPIRATCPAHLILLDFITRTILGEQYKSFSSSLCNLLHSPVYLLPPRSKYSPQHYVRRALPLPLYFISIILCSPCAQLLADSPCGSPEMRQFVDNPVNLHGHQKTFAQSTTSIEMWSSFLGWLIGKLSANGALKYETSVVCQLPVTTDWWLLSAGP